MRHNANLFKGLRAVAVTLILGTVVLCSAAKADIITTFGGGYKIPATTSYVLRPECFKVKSTQPYYREFASCGGDNPVFVGWPVAWRSDRNGPFNYTVGWFHMSHWFDGGSDRETHMDCLCMTVEFNWSKRK